MRRDTHRRLSGATLVAIALAAVASARPAPQAKVSDLAVTAIDIAVDRYKATLDDYLVLMCTSDREEALAKDKDIGAYVRLMHAAKANLAVILMPSGDNKGPTYVVYFDTSRPVGVLAYDSGQGGLKDDLVEKQFQPFTGATPKGARRPVFREGEMHADDGTVIYTLKVTGWQ